MTLNIAVVGGGVAGTSAAWLLARRHAVTLYERNPYVGGHTHTIEVPSAAGTLPIDTGFIVYNEPNYPLLTQLLKALGIRTQATDMSFSVSIDRGRIEYSGTGLNTLFAQRRNLLRMGHWRMLRDILRFNRDARASLDDPALEQQSLGEFLTRGGYGREMIDRYLLPMSAAIWSCPTHTMSAFPTASVLRFLANHGLIGLRQRPQWRTVAGGSYRYIQRMLNSAPIGLRLQDPVVRVHRRAGGVEVLTRGGVRATHDRVVFGCHADEVLGLLESPHPREREVLDRFRYQTNRAVLHQDIRLMPHRRLAWSSWNYMTGGQGHASSAVSVTYWMNRLQRLKGAQPYLVTLNPVCEPAPEKVISEMRYDHPIYDQAAISAQAQIPSLQGRDRLWFCGSYTGYGFHEDALRSAVDVAARLGAPPPWEGAACVVAPPLSNPGIGRATAS